MPASLEFATDQPSATQALAAALASTLRLGDLLVLAGDLGAGKTCFTQGLARGLGIDDRVTSPTFTLANRYQGTGGDGSPLELNHLDVYRLDDIGETLDLDLPELLESGVTVIEWGEQIDAALPADHLIVRILHGDGSEGDGADDDAAVGEDDDRTLRFEVGGPSWEARLPTLRAALEGAHS